MAARDEFHSKHNAPCFAVIETNEIFKSDEKTYSAGVFTYIAGNCFFE